MSAQRLLRVGVAGLGMAGGVMTAVIARHPRLELRAAADPHELLRERFARDFGKPSLADIAELARREDIDAIYIATPQQYHAAHAEIAARHGKHVVVEKPMAMSLADCDRMLAASRAAGIQLIVGHTHAFDPAVGAIRRLVVDGTLGRPLLLNGFNYTSFLYRPRRPEELDPARGGGVLWNQMPHQFDTVRFIVGQAVRSVRAMTAAIDPKRVVDGCCAAFIEFEGGAVANLVYSGYDRFDSDEWCGWLGASGNSKRPAHGGARRALAAIDPQNELAERKNRWSYGGEALGAATHFDGQPHFGQLIVSCERGEVRFAPQGLMVYDQQGAREVNLPSGTRPSHTAVWDELCAAVLDDIPPAHDGTFARGTVELCLAVAESARTRREQVLQS